MTWIRRHALLSALLGIALLFALVLAGVGTYAASEAGRLPWQEDPTRIPIVPFEGIPGFSAPTPTPAASPTTLSPGGTS